MKFFEKLNQINKNIWFILIFLISVLFYLFNINYSDIWTDETFTKALVQHSFKDMLGLIKNDFHPPLYFYALKIFVSIFGISTFTLRFFSVLGVLSIMVLSYFKGQKVFGKSGALYFCLLIFSLPMLASYSHDARMYTWGAFSITGVFLYAVSYISTNKKSDLLLLMVFSLLAAYTHYYGLIAAFGANVYVSELLFFRKNRNWKQHLGYSLVTALFYLPWFFVLLYHTKKAQEFFWVPAISLDTIKSCFILPFAQKFWMKLFSWIMVVCVYGSTLWVVYRNFIVRKDKYGVALGLSLFIFFFTIITAGIISMFSQPILYHRYIMNIVIMLMVPPTLFLITVENKWVRAGVLVLIISCGCIISVRTSYFSYGPYKQSVEYLHYAHPDVKKIFHVIEVSAGPFIEYRAPEMENYWYKPEKTLVFTNMDVFKNLQTISSLDKALKKNEIFCTVSFCELPFNEVNLSRILSESQIMDIDTIDDNKAGADKIYVNKIVLYILKYGSEKKQNNYHSL